MWPWRQKIFPNSWELWDFQAKFSLCVTALEIDSQVPKNLVIYIKCVGEGNGYPLQYSCLENPMDSGAWWAPVQGGREESDRTERSTAAHQMCTEFYQVSRFQALKDADWVMDSVIHSFTSSRGQTLSNDCIPGLCVKSWNTQKNKNVCVYLPDYIYENVHCWFIHNS